MLIQTRKLRAANGAPLCSPVSAMRSNIAARSMAMAPASSSAPGERRAAPLPASTSVRYGPSRGEAYRVTPITLLSGSSLLTNRSMASVSASSAPSSGLIS